MDFNGHWRTIFTKNQYFARNCRSKTSGEPYDKISYSVRALSDYICKLEAENSANFNNAKTCNFYTGPLLQGLTHRDHK